MAYDNGKEVAFYIGTLDHRWALPPQHHYGIEARLSWFDAGYLLPGEKTSEKW